ncbi:MAG: DUF2911 domain-containing protein [Cryomorphaceae bacterium]
MKKIQTISLLFLAFLFVGTSLHAQDKADRPSPPKTAEATLASGKVIIDYSSPAVKEREIWGELVPYGKMWRTGANEATTIMLEKDMKVGGKLIPAGKYALFTIPGKDEWTVVINSEWDQWGAYNYDESKDVHRFTVKPNMNKENQERLTFDVSDDGTVTMMWEKMAISFEIG